MYISKQCNCSQGVQNIEMQGNIADRLEWVEERLFMGGTSGHFGKKNQTRFAIIHRKKTVFY